MEGVKFQWLKDVFKGGLIDDVGVHNFPITHSRTFKNGRLVNGSFVVRNGYKKVYEGTDVKRVYELVSVNGTLYAVFNRELYSIDLDAGTATQKSTSTLPDARIRVITHSKYLILLTGVGYPFVYNTVADTRTQLTSSNIASGANPSIGEVYGNYTFVVGGANSDDLYVSRAITAANPEYSYDWAGSGFEVIKSKSPIRSLKSTLQRMFIFTDKTVEYLDQSTISEIGGSQYRYTQPISRDNVPVSHEAVVVANDRMFMLTTDKNIKEVGRAGINDIEITTISGSIRGFLEKLDDDLSNTSAVYNQEEELVMWYVRKKGSTINNRVVIYDMQNNTFYYDTKIFSCATYHNNKLYTGGYTTAFIYLDNDGHDDDGSVIPREVDKETDLGDPVMEKMFSQVGMAGEHNTLSTIKIDVSVDGEVEAGNLQIAGQSTLSGGLGIFPIGSKPIGGEFQQVSTKSFEKLIDKDTLRARGVKIRIRIYGEKYGGKTIISKLGIGATATRQVGREYHL